MSLFKTDSQEQKLIQIVESEGTTMKVRNSKADFVIDVPLLQARHVYFLAKDQ